MANLFVASLLWLKTFNDSPGGRFLAGLCPFSPSILTTTISCGWTIGASLPYPPPPRGPKRATVLGFFQEPNPYISSIIKFSPQFHAKHHLQDFSTICCFIFWIPQPAIFTKHTTQVVVFFLIKPSPISVKGVQLLCVLLIFFVVDNVMIYC